MQKSGGTLSLPFRMYLFGNTNAPGAVLQAEAPARGCSEQDLIRIATAFVVFPKAAAGWKPGR